MRESEWMESAEAMDLHEKSVVLGTAIDALTMGEVMARIEASLDTGAGCVSAS